MTTIITIGRKFSISSIAGDKSDLDTGQGREERKPRRFSMER